MIFLSFRVLNFFSIFSDIGMKMSVCTVALSTLLLNWFLLLREEDYENFFEYKVMILRENEMDTACNTHREMRNA
jgi:hypothetical protein